MKAMHTENQPLELLSKHLESLGLKNPAIFNAENQLFDKRDKPAESAIVFLPKSKALIDMTLAFVSGIVAPDGTIVLAGSNDGGIGSAKKLFEANVGPVEKKIVGNHSALYIGKNKKLGAEKKLEDYLSYSTLVYKDMPLVIANLPGVFSIGELDEGTNLLLAHIPYDKKKVLDMGCGTGIIGAVYKKRAPKSSVMMSDYSYVAVEATKKTLDINKLDATVALSDLFSHIEDKFDLIVTNPPFHKGIGTDYSFIETFARDAKKHLNKGGEVYIVANSFLPYQEILEKHIGPTEIIVDNKKFRIFKTKAL